MTLLSVRDLSLSIGRKPILDKVAFDIGAGEVFGLVGESGSGKSMTALSVMGLAPEGARPAGTAELGGENLLALSERALCARRGREIGMIFQEPMTALNPVMTIGDQVAETVRIHGAAGAAEARAIARERLDRVGLPGDRFPLDLYPHEISGGQRQRVAIAMAIALRPRLLIADEPTTALDVTTQARILDLLAGLVRDDGMGLLLITHDLAVVAGLADRVAVMQSGRIVEEGATEALFRARRHPYTRDLFAASAHVPRRSVPAAPRSGSGYLDEEEAGPLLRVEGAVREYRLPRPAPLAPRPVLRAVDGVSFDLRRGESLGLVGESGCGKSTLTRAILGLDPLSAGRILLDGRAVRAGETPFDLRAKMQVVFQDPYGSFDPRHRVRRLVAEPFHLTGVPPDADARVAEALREVGLSPDDGQRFIHEFSGGQRQRIAIARALIIRPALIVLDEAVSALDVRVRAQVLDLLAGLQASHGLSYLFISHDLSVVRAVTDRVMVMRAGRIVEAGTTAEVLGRPQTDYARELLRATPVIPADWMRR
jgi:peptide/nickel transport system ATP-binding protein